MNWLQLILDWLNAYRYFEADDSDPTRDAFNNRIKRR